MNKAVKVAVGAALVSMAGGVAVSGETSTSYVNLWALVAPTCSITDVFLTDVDLTQQIQSDGSIASPVADPITNGAIVCSGTITETTLNMVSQEHGLKSGSIILPYKITGGFGSETTTPTPLIPIVPFSSSIGPASDLLLTAMSPVSTPTLVVTLDDQGSGTAKAGNYADILTAVVITAP
jgi:hypothetical protein